MLGGIYLVTNYKHISLSSPFKRQSQKMVKHTQAIRREFADELFEFV